MSDLSLYCYLEFWQFKLCFFWSEFEKKSAEKKTRLGVIMKIATHKKSKDSREASE